MPHYNYVGDSILGYKSHMGAGSITSNVKSDKTLVVVKDVYDTKRRLKPVARNSALCSVIMWRWAATQCSIREQ